MGFSVAFLLIWVWEFASCEKRQRGRWRPGWGHQEGPGRDILFLLAKMSQNSIDDVLVFDATVRRSDDNLDRTNAAATNSNIDIEYSLESLGEVIAAWHSAGVLTSAFAHVLSALPRLAGVTAPRQR